MTTPIPPSLTESLDHRDPRVSPIRVIDLPSPGRRDHIKQIVFTLFAIEVGSFILEIIDTRSQAKFMSGIAVLTTAAVLLFVLIWVCTLRISLALRHAEIRKMINASTAPNAESIFREVAKRSHNFDFYRNAVYAFKLLAARGASGFVVRFGQYAQSPLPTPFPHPFEPIPLTVSDPHFQALLAGDAQQRGLQPRPLPIAQEGTAGAMQTTGYFVIAVAMCGVLILGYPSIRNFLATGRPGYDLLMLSICIVLAAVHLISAGAAANFRWFAVPGGVIIPLRSNRRYLTAHQGILMFSSQTARGHTFYTVHIGDTAGTRITPMSAPLADFLLRAWLSPHPPPPLQELQGLIPNLRAHSAAPSIDRARPQS